MEVRSTCGEDRLANPVDLVPADENGSDWVVASACEAATVETHHLDHFASHGLVASGLEVALKQPHSVRERLVEQFL